MNDSPSMSPEELFRHQWNDIMDRWMLAEAGDPEYPQLTGRQRSLLQQIRPIELAGRYMILEADSRYAREEVESNLRPKILTVFSRELERDIKLTIDVKQNDQHSGDAQPQQGGPGKEHSGGAPAQRASLSQHSSPSVAEHRRHSGEERFHRLQTTEPAAPTRQQLAEEHARGYEASLHGYDKEPSPNPEGWGHMASPSLGTTAPHTDPSVSGTGLASTQKENQEAHGGNAGQTHAGQTPRPAPQNNGVEEPHINPAYTFENFVTGSSNQLAYAACRAVAEYPGASYNPLLIWGESGLGKTHLLHAIGHYARELQPNMRIKYVSSEELTNDFINSISAGQRDDFKRRYRNLDLLIVDDTQFLQGKESTQEEFFHTFNALHQAGKQIVLSSDRPPQKLTTLEDRLRTRFESGLITDVQTPDLETRMAILSRKAESRNVELPQDVKELIASRYEKSIRELEGALTRVIAYCSLGHQPLSLQSATAALRDIMPDDADTEITPQLVIDVVAEFYNITSAEILGKGRARTIANARQIGMYLCRELTDLSLPKVGAAFGGRDHTTVMYAERRINDKIQEDHKTFNEVQELTQRIKTRARN